MNNSIDIKDWLLLEMTSNRSVWQALKDRLEQERRHMVEEKDKQIAKMYPPTHSLTHALYGTAELSLIFNL